MADNFENFAPYAPGVAVERTIDHHRGVGLANPVTYTTLLRIGIKETMVSRTHQTLRFLGFIDEQGTHLPAFDRLRRASETEYPAVLAEVLQAAYLPVFTSINPATADDIQLADAFRGFEPSAQRVKMVTLFRVLCQRAGIMPELVRRQGKTGRVYILNKPQQSNLRKPAEAQPSPAAPEPPRAFTPSMATRADYALVSSVFQQLPQNGRWTEGRRERWLSAMTSAVDLLVDVVSADARDAVWRNGDSDVPVRVNGSYGTDEKGREYVSIEGSNTGIPADEIEDAEG